MAVPCLYASMHFFPLGVHFQSCCQLGEVTLFIRTGDLIASLERLEDQNGFALRATI
jgi:hypothetical protein